MKARSFGVAGLIFLLSAAFTSKAQEISNPVIKVLPTAKQTAIKLLVAENADNSVEVKFYSNEGAIASDLIVGANINNGFIKCYDFQKLKEKSFWMSVRTLNTSVVYKITRTDDAVEARLEQATYQYPVVAAR